MKEWANQENTACPNVVHQDEAIRITLLTPRMLRLEKGAFTDLPTQTVWCRNLGQVPFDAETGNGICRIKTEAAEFLVDLKRGRVTSVKPAGGEAVTDFRKGNLLGTARTLDMTNGSIKLEPGIMSRSGASTMDDSRSLLLAEDGILPRPKCADIYCFAYGHDYQGLLTDFFKITGPVPLIPKYALGNWWSRYRAYTQEEYRSLMEEFISRNIPITVATIDMDWHWTDVMTRFGPEADPGKPQTREEVFYNYVLKGWTGYSWNRELFPDHQELLKWLHDRNFRVTLNVHPSQGIRYYEDCYESFCRRLGKDPDEKKRIPFDIGDPSFLEAYFEEAHHPLEAEGVDFWWIDWQQGKKTGIKGLDPLWALNHYHTLDGARENKRPLILSRYAGLGSHRYPLGFSGDTITTWKSLAFQPYFTANAANAGYTWWSHDIGGHMHGVQDDELYLRWLQFGVFSPINRLHSSNSDFMGKEPWKRSWAVEELANRFLRLRHKLIPYLYTANYRTHRQGIPLCSPMYYRYDCEDAYRAKGQYLFGDQLIVSPITRPGDKRLNLAYSDVWLPEGRWTDVFNGKIYSGGKWIRMYRNLNCIPVLAGSGSVVPMYKEGGTNDLSLEQPLEIHIWRGNGSYELYEDDGETNAYRRGEFAITTFTVEETGEELIFRIHPPEEGKGILPEERTMYLRFRDLIGGELTVNGRKESFRDNLPVLVSGEPVEVRIRQYIPLKNRNKEELHWALLTRIQGRNDWKARRLNGKRPLPEYIRRALDELDNLYYE